jgi:hypothetical protein
MGPKLEYEKQLSIDAWDDDYPIFLWSSFYKPIM